MSKSKYQADLWVIASALALLAALALACCKGATAGNCHQQLVAVKQRVVKQILPVQPVAVDHYASGVSQHVDYRIGEEIRMRAYIREELLRAIQQLQQPQQAPQPYSQPQPQQQPCEPCRPGSEPPTSPPVFSQTSPVLVQSACAKCHTGDNPKGGFAMNLADPASRFRMMQQVYSGAMPKGRQLSSEEKTQLIAELLQ